ncbi:MAG TPA: ComF family protein, partial [Rhodothermales bacterium]|nr:ComF family protein [Rhodothermales bacterium]
MRLARRATANVRLLARGLAALAFPPACLACATALSDDGIPLCPSCLADLDPVDPAALSAHLSPAATLDSAWAAWYYDPDGPLGALFHAIKYGHRPRYARLLGRALAPRVALPPGTDALLPIPLTRVRFLERGYNQAEELARGLGETLGLPVHPDLLRRAAFIRSQTRLGRGARRANVAHAFDAAPEAAGLHLVLVDDVVTTGATASACVRALRQAGVRTNAVLVLTSARPHRPG